MTSDGDAAPYEDLMDLAEKPGALRRALARYQEPCHKRSVLEIIVTAAPFLVLWGLAVFLVGRHWWWGAALTVPAAAFLVRLFMIQHDCGHWSFFRSGAANDWTGRVIGALTMTPYAYWRRTHAIHHATSGNLDRRSLGGVETLTVEEYRSRSRLGRLAYRLYRNPLVMFGLGPAYMFVLQHRLPIGLMREPRAWLSVLGNAAGIAVLILPQLLLGGVQALWMVYLPMVIMAASVGVWLFYVQHQFEGAYWARSGSWKVARAGLLGSSQLVLPPLLRWFTANIGAHHVHHVGPKIPFYRLPQVLRDHPELRGMNRVGVADAFRAVRLSLWDEAKGRLVSFHEARV